MDSDIVYTVVQEYGTRSEDDLRGVVPGDRVRLADTLHIEGRGAFVPLFVVSDTGRRRFLPTFVPMDDLVHVLDFANAETGADYRKRLAIQKARHSLAAAADDLVRYAGKDVALSDLRGEIIRCSL